jgi:hypothetical protein
MANSLAPFVALHFAERSGRRLVVRPRERYEELVDFLAPGSTLHELQAEDVEDSALTLKVISKQLEEGHFRQF